MSCKGIVFDMNLVYILFIFSLYLFRTCCMINVYLLYDKCVPAVCSKCTCRMFKMYLPYVQNVPAVYQSSESQAALRAECMPAALRAECQRRRNAPSASGGAMRRV